MLGVERKVNKFARMVGGLSQKEQRSLEMAVLKPDKLPPIIQRVEYLTPLRRDYVKLKFRVHHDFDLFCNYFKVLNYVETNVTDLSRLIAILNAMEAGVITYSEIEEKYFPISPDRDEVKLVFPTPELYHLFCKHFKVLTSKELCAPELTRLMTILQDLEDGRLLYENGEIRILIEE